MYCHIVCSWPWLRLLIWYPTLETSVLCLWYFFVEPEIVFCHLVSLVINSCKYSVYRLISVWSFTLCGGSGGVGQNFIRWSKLAGRSLAFVCLMSWPSFLITNSPSSDSSPNMVVTYLSLFRDTRRDFCPLVRIRDFLPVHIFKLRDTLSITKSGFMVAYNIDKSLILIMTRSLHHQSRLSHLCFECLNPTEKFFVW